MNNSDGVGIFDSLLDSEEQPIESEVETEVDAEAVESEEVEAQESIEDVDDESDDSDSEDTVYQIGDKEYTLKKLEELEQGNLRQADYTKKTQATAKLQKELESERALIAEAKEALLAKSSEIEALLKDSADKMDWDYLRDSDPSEYLRQKELQQKREEAANKAKEELRAMKEAEFNNRITLEQKALLEALPEWSDEEVMKADMKLINDYFEANNFTDDDMSELVNHKAYIAFLKAAKLDSMSNKSIKTEKAVKSAPKKVKATVKTKTTSSTAIKSPYSDLASALYS